MWYYGAKYLEGRFNSPDHFVFAYHDLLVGTFGHRSTELEKYDRNIPVIAK